MGAPWKGLGGEERWDLMKDRRVLSVTIAHENEYESDDGDALVLTPDEPLTVEEVLWLLAPEVAAGWE